MPFVEYLEQRTGFPIELTVESSHEKVLSGLRNNFYDIAFMNAYYETKAVEYDEIASVFRFHTPRGQTYRTCFIVSDDSIIRHPHEMAGDYLALTVSKESLAGYYIPLIELGRHGIDIEKVFRQIIFSETQESVLKGVAYGLIDAGAVTDDLLEDVRYQYLASQVRTVIISDPIPQWAAVMQTGMKQEMLSVIIEQMSGMHLDPEGREVLAKAGLLRFAPSGDSDLSLSELYVKAAGVIDASAD
jgi:ABC-type phosphate/phosphonate transport system substrate-binding protein